MRWRPRSQLTLLAILIVVVSSVFVLRELALQAEARARENLRAVSFALAQHVESTLERADEIGRAVRDEFLAGRDYAAFARNTYRSLDPELFIQIALIDARGINIFSTVPDFRPVDLADRRHFRVHADGDGRDFLFISTPVLGRISKKLTLQLSRPIRAADSRFLGVTVISINPEKFAAVYRELIWDDGVISLTGFDGINRIRVDKNGFRFGHDISGQPWFPRVRAQTSGYQEILSSTDGLERSMAYQQVPRFSLYVAVSVPTAAIDRKYVGPYRNYMAVLAVALVAILVALLVLALRIQRLNLRLVGANADLQMSMRKASLASEAKSRFLAAVSHELRTPLHGILGHAQLVKLGQHDSKVAESAGAIFNSANHLLAIVNQLLDLSKVESGQQAPELSEVPLRPMIDDVMAAHAAPAAQRGLVLELDWGADTSERVQTDGLMLKRILHNLLSNAVKFTETGRIVVHTLRGEGAVEFRIEDTGIGIGPEDQRRIFTNYTQVHDFQTRRIAGTGLGLALSRQLVELLGGRIGVQSQVGVGSTFWFVLPLEPRIGAATGG